MESEDLLLAAEAQMRRRLPRGDDRPAKKARAEGPGADGSGEEDDPSSGTATKRFNYEAIKTLEQGTAAGVFITCGFRKEKSATREVTALILERLAPAPGAAGPSAPTEAEQPAAAGAPAEPSLSVVKLGCCGVVLLMLSSPDSPPGSAEAGAGGGGGGASAAREAQRVCSEIIEGVANGRLPRLAHAQRVLPIITTCPLQLPELEAAGRRLAPLVAEAAAPAGDTEGDGKGGNELTVSFGISYKEKRGNVEGGSGSGAADEPAAPPGEGAPGPAPARGEVLAAIARGLTAALREEHGVAARVDLKDPEVTVFAEKLPLARAGGLIGLAALPRRLCVADGKKLAVTPVGPVAEQQQQKKKGRGQK